MLGILHVLNFMHLESIGTVYGKTRERKVISPSLNCMTLDLSLWQHDFSLYPFLQSTIKIKCVFVHHFDIIINVKARCFSTFI